MTVTESTAASATVTDAQALFEEARQRRRRRYRRSGAVVALVLSIGVALFVGLAGIMQMSAKPNTGTTFHPGPLSLQAAACPTPSTWSTFDDRVQGLRFDHPACWRAAQYAEVSSLSSSIVYLSNQSTHEPCVTTTYPTITGVTSSPRPLSSTTCGLPLAHLAPGGVLVQWSADGFPGSSFEQMPGTSITVDGFAAREAVDRPGTCSAIGADETITVDVARSVEWNYYRVRVCLRGPDIKGETANVQHMLASTTFSNGG